MRVIGSKSEQFRTMLLHSFILISEMSFLILCLLFVPQAWAGESKRDIVMMVDNSGSMKKNDPEFLAHRALKAFITANDDDTRLALISFDKNVKLAVPFTSLTDASRPTLFDAVKKIDYSGPLTNSPAALERAIFEIALHGRDDAEKSIIFITDGVVDTGNKARDKQQEAWMLEELSTLASKLNIRIFGIAFAEAANYQLLQNLVSKTKGEYFRVLIADELPRIFTRLEAISRPTDKPILQESSQPPIELKRENQNVDENNTFPAPIEDENFNTEYALKGDESLAQPQPIRIPIMLFNKARRLYTGNELIIYSITLISLLTLGVLLLSRKSTPPELTSHSMYDSSVRHEQVKALLIDINNHTSNRNHPLSKKITKIGRANTGTLNNNIHHLLIDRPTIGREHALIEYKDESHWLVDLDSINGTFINGKRVKGRARLKDGNRISFHDVQFIFSVPGLNKFEKTVGVPIFSSQEEAEHDEAGLFTKRSYNSDFTQTSSMTSTNINKSRIDINAYQRSHEKAGLKLTQKDEQYSKSISNTGLQNQNISKSFNDRATRSICNQSEAKLKSKTTPGAESCSPTKRKTIRLDSTKLPPNTNTVELKQNSRQSDTVEIQVIPSSELNKKTTNLKEKTIELDFSEMTAVKNIDKQLRVSRKADTEEISQKTFELPIQR